MAVSYGVKTKILLDKLLIYRKKAVRLLSFAHYQEHSSPLFKELNLLKLTDMIKLNNILFVHDTINKNTPVIFKDYFIFNEVSHQHDTINNLASTYSIPNGSLQIQDYRTNSGKSSIKYICSSIWNTFLKDLSMKTLKSIIRILSGSARLMSKLLKAY